MSTTTANAPSTAPSGPGSRVTVFRTHTLLPSGRRYRLSIRYGSPVRTASANFSAFAPASRGCVIDCCVRTPTNSPRGQPTIPQNRSLTYRNRPSASTCDSPTVARVTSSRNRSSDTPHRAAGQFGVDLPHDRHHPRRPPRSRPSARPGRAAGGSGWPPTAARPGPPGRGRRGAARPPARRWPAPAGSSGRSCAARPGSTSATVRPRWSAAGRPLIAASPGSIRRYRNSRSSTATPTSVAGRSRGGGGPGRKGTPARVAASSTAMSRTEAFCANAAA